MQKYSPTPVISSSCGSISARRASTASTITGGALRSRASAADCAPWRRATGRSAFSWSIRTLPSPSTPSTIRSLISASAQPVDSRHRERRAHRARPITGPSRPDSHVRVGDLSFKVTPSVAYRVTLILRAADGRELARNLYRDPSIIRRTRGPSPADGPGNRHAAVVGRGKGLIPPALPQRR